MGSNDFAITALWDNAVTDQDAVDRLKAVSAAKVALAGTWPFLAVAQSQEAFEERLALMKEPIEASTPPDVLDEVMASLRSNFTELHTARLTRQAASHTAARRITASASETLPSAFVHVHKHGSGEDEYHQVDHVAGPTWLNTIAHVGDRDSAIAQGRQFAVQNGLPLYENGRYVEGRKLRELFAPDEEIFDAKVGAWVPVSRLGSVTAAQTFRAGDSARIGLSVEAHEKLRGNWGEHLAGKFNDGHVTQYVGWAQSEGHDPNHVNTLKTYEKKPGIGRAHADHIADALYVGGGEPNWRSEGHRDASRHTAAPKGADNYSAGRSPCCDAQGHRPDKSGDFFCMDCGNTFKDKSAADQSKKKGSRRTAAADPTTTTGGVPANYNGGDNNDWRYHYPSPPQATAQGGQPTAPSPLNAGVVNQVGQTSVGPNGFPLDYAQGEYGGAAAKMQEILTPTQWTVTPGTEWPERPNAGSFDQTPRVARRHTAVADHHRDQAKQGYEHAALWASTGEDGEPLDDKHEEVHPDARAAMHRDVDSFLDNHSEDAHAHAAKVGWGGVGHDLFLTRNGHGAGFWDRGTGAVGDRLTHAAHGMGEDSLYEGDDGAVHSSLENPHRRQGSRRRTASRRQASKGQDSDRNGRPQSTDDFHTYNPSQMDYNTGEGRDELHDELISKGSDHKRQGMDQRQHAKVYDELQGRYGKDAAEAYRYGYQTSKMAGRRQATEGAAPTPGPNPNYFSQGTQGIQGPPSFPENPSSAIEPKPAPNIDAGVYSEGQTPEVSQGTASDGTVDGQGYNRTAAKTKYQPGYPHMVIHPAETFKNGDEPDFQLHEVKLHESPDSSFTVGHWPASTVEDKAKEFGSQYMRWNGHRTDPPVHKLGSRPFGRSAEERTAAHDRQAEHDDARLDDHMERAHERGEHDGGETNPHCWRCQQHTAAGQARCEHCGNPQVPNLGDYPICGSCMDKLTEHGRGMHDGHRDQACPDCQGGHVSRTASTDGKIVGVCDHCGERVRYHTDKGGHLQHLHNSSARCSDGKVATAMRMPWGQYEARFRVDAAVLENPTAENPTGRGSDPYRAKTDFEGFEKQRPRQKMEDMNANTPTTAGEPIKTRNSNTPLPGADLDEDGPRERDDQDESDED